MSKMLAGCPARSARGLRLVCVLSGLSTVSFWGASTAHAAANAHAATGRWFIKEADEGSASVWFGTLGWASTANIKWVSGKNTYDGVVQPAQVTATESKFVVPAVGLPTGKVWANFSDVWPNPIIIGSSRATTAGSGKSTVGAVFYSAEWTVQAGGLLRAAAGGNYDSKITADDPWNMYPADFSSFTAGATTYSLYVPFSLMGGSNSAGPSAGGDSFDDFDVFYRTASSTTDLLHINLHGTVATVTTASSFGSSLRLYSQTSQTSSPAGGSTTPGTLTSGGALQTAIQTDIGTDMNVDTEQDLGIVLSGISIPTVLMPDGEVAQIEVTSDANDSASNVPEPTSALLIAAVGAFSLRRKGRRSSSRTAR